MKRLKFIFTVICTLLITVSLAACGGGGDQNGGTPAEPNAPLT